MFLQFCHYFGISERKYRDIIFSISIFKVDFLTRTINGWPILEFQYLTVKSALLFEPSLERYFLKDILVQTNAIHPLGGFDVRWPYLLTWTFHFFFQFYVVLRSYLKKSLANPVRFDQNYIC